MSFQVAQIILMHQKLKNHIFKILYQTFCDFNASLFYGMAIVMVLSLEYLKDAV
jgi:hypothetical protein